jgi:predicted nucleic acid-binding protein
MNINWKEIRNYQIIMLKNGYNGIGIPDLLIVQNCIQNDIPLITHDMHFEKISKYLPLKLY